MINYSSVIHILCGGVNYAPTGSGVSNPSGIVNKLNQKNKEYDYKEAN